MSLFNLDATTKSISVVMSGAPATTNPDFTSAWADNNGSTFTEGSTDGVLNGTTPVTLVASPGASTRRVIKYITIQNKDTDAVTITVSLISSSGTRQIAKVTLAVNDTWTTDGTYDSDGNLKTTGGGSGTVTSVTSANSDATVATTTTTPVITIVSAPILTTTRTVWGQNFNGSANVTGSLTAVTDITGGATNMVVTAGTGNSRTLALRSTTSGGTATTFLTGDASQNTTLAGNLTLGASTSAITGAAGNMTIISGTGASRTMILQTTTSGSVATTALTLNADQTASFAGAITSNTVAVPTISSTSTLTNKSIGGALTLEENASIALDPALSADETWTGITITGAAKGALAIGDLIVKTNSTNTRWEAVDANVITAAAGDARGTLGICLTTASNAGDAINILLTGVVASAAFPDFTTLNAPLYISETAGDMTLTQPTTANVCIRVIGFSLTATELYFNPSSDYVTPV